MKTQMELANSENLGRAIFFNCCWDLYGLRLDITSDVNVFA